MKRIVKETFKDGKVQYRVETDRCFFGLIKCGWHTDTTPVGMDEYITEIGAIFNTLEEAQKFCGIDPNPVVNREVIVNKGL